MYDNLRIKILYKILDKLVNRDAKDSLTLVHITKLQFYVSFAFFYMFCKLTAYITFFEKVNLKTQYYEKRILAFFNFIQNYNDIGKYTYATNRGYLRQGEKELFEM